MLNVYSVTNVNNYLYMLHNTYEYEPTNHKLTNIYRIKN